MRPLPAVMTNMGVGSESARLRTSWTFIMALLLAITGLPHDTAGQQAEDTVLTNISDSLTFSQTSSQVTGDFQVTGMSTPSVVQIVPTDVAAPVTTDSVNYVMSTGDVVNSKSDFSPPIISTGTTASSSLDTGITSISAEIIASSSLDAGIHLSSAQMDTPDFIARSSLDSGMQQSSTQPLSLETISSSSLYTSTLSSISEIIPTSSLDNSVQSFSSDIQTSSSTHLFSPAIAGSSASASTIVILPNTVDGDSSSASSFYSPEPASSDSPSPTSSATSDVNEPPPSYSNVSAQTPSLFESSRPADSDSSAALTATSSTQLETTYLATLGVITSDVIKTTQESSNLVTPSFTTVVNLESSNLGTVSPVSVSGESSNMETPVLSPYHTSSLLETSSGDILSSLQTSVPSSATHVPQTPEISTSDYAISSASETQPEATIGLTTSDLMTTALLTMTPSAPSLTALTDTSPGSFSPGTESSVTVTMETTDSTLSTSGSVTHASSQLSSADVTYTDPVTFSHDIILTTPIDTLSETPLISPTPTEMTLTSYIATDVTTMLGSSVTQADSSSVSISMGTSGFTPLSEPDIRPNSYEGSGPSMAVSFVPGMSTDTLTLTTLITFDHQETTVTSAGSDLSTVSSMTNDILHSSLFTSSVSDVLETSSNMHASFLSSMISDALQTGDTSSLSETVEETSPSVSSMFASSPLWIMSSDVFQTNSPSMITGLISNAAHSTSSDMSWIATSSILTDHVPEDTLTSPSMDPPTPQYTTLEQSQKMTSPSIYISVLTSISAWEPSPTTTATSHSMEIPVANYSSSDEILLSKMTSSLLDWISISDISTKESSVDTPSSERMELTAFSSAVPTEELAVTIVTKSVTDFFLESNMTPELLPTSVSYTDSVATSSVYNSIDINTSYDVNVYDSSQNITRWSSVESSTVIVLTSSSVFDEETVSVVSSNRSTSVIPSSYFIVDENVILTTSTEQATTTTLHQSASTPLDSLSESRSPQGVFGDSAMSHTHTESAVDEVTPTAWSDQMNYSLSVTDSVSPEAVVFTSTGELTATTLTLLMPSFSESAHFDSVDHTSAVSGETGSVSSEEISSRTENTSILYSVPLTDTVVDSGAVDSETSLNWISTFLTNSSEITRTVEYVTVSMTSDHSLYTWPSLTSLYSESGWSFSEMTSLMNGTPPFPADLQTSYQSSLVSIETTYTPLPENISPVLTVETLYQTLDLSQAYSMTQTKDLVTSTQNDSSISSLNVTDVRETIQETPTPTELMFSFSPSSSISDDQTTDSFIRTPSLRDDLNATSTWYLDPSILTSDVKTSDHSEFNTSATNLPGDSLLPLSEAPTSQMTPVQGSYQTLSPLQTWEVVHTDSMSVTEATPNLSLASSPFDNLTSYNETKSVLPTASYLSDQHSTSTLITESDTPLMSVTETAPYWSPASSLSDTLTAYNATISVLQTASYLSDQLFTSAFLTESDTPLMSLTETAPYWSLAPSPSDNLTSYTPTISVVPTSSYLSDQLFTSAFLTESDAPLISVTEVTLNFSSASSPHDILTSSYSTVPVPLLTGSDVSTQVPSYTPTNQSHTPLTSESTPPLPPLTTASIEQFASTVSEFSEVTVMASASFVDTSETTLPSPVSFSSTTYGGVDASSSFWTTVNNTQDMMTNLLQSSSLSSTDQTTATDTSLVLIDSTLVMFSSSSPSPYSSEFIAANKSSFEISSGISSSSDLIDLSTMGIFSDLSSSFGSTYPTLIDTSYLTSYLDSSLLVSLLSSEWLMSNMSTDLFQTTSGSWTATSIEQMSTAASDTFSSAASLTITASFNWTMSSGEIIEPTLPFTPTQDVVSTEVVIQDNSSLLIISTVVPTSSLSSIPLSPTPVSSVLLSSSILPTTTPTIGTTLPTIENSKNKTEFWIVTRFKVRPSVDVLSAEFKNSIEKGLANAFYLSRIRNEEKINGTYVPLKRKRAASANADPSIQVEVVSLTRPDTLTVAATYVVQENGQLVPAQQATDRLNLLSSQEMAIQTGQVVSLTAEPYNKPASSEDNTKWIILGCVVGGVLLIAIVIFILCCCCGCRCCQGKVEEKPVTMEGVKSYVDDEPEARRKSFALNSKKGKYAVSSEVEDEALYASIKPKVKGNKKMMNPQISDEKPETDLEERPAKKLRQDTPQKKRRKKALDTNEELRSVYESQMASLQTRTLSNGEYTLTSQPTVEEEGDLLENAEEERKKNKQRLREKKRTGHGSPNLDSTAKAYDSAQREIDKVLGPRLSHEDSEEKKNKEKTKKKKENKGKDNEGFVDDEKKEDTLEEARQRMHKLLDDAFSLISHSKSSISNKIQPVSSSDEPSSMISKPNTPREDRSVPANINSPATDEKKHTPLNVQRTHEPYDSSGLVTWSPYRASDEIAVISLPHTQTNLSTQPPQQEKLTTSTFNESAPPSRRTSYFATQPGEPIVIRTKDIDSSLPPSGNQKQKILNGDSLQHIANGSRKHHETFQNPVYENTLPLRTMDSYSEPYHGLASYQDLPVSHLTDNGRKISNGRPPVRQSAWQEERSKLGSLGLPLSASSSPRDTIDVRGHAAPQRGERKHYDEVDVIKESLRPGASPQPLINSLREELQMLSSKKHSGTTTSSTNGETVKMKSTEPGRRSFMQGDSESSWGSMHRNTSNV